MLKFYSAYQQKLLYVDAVYQSQQPFQFYRESVRFVREILKRKLIAIWKYHSEEGKQKQASQSLTGIYFAKDEHFFCDNSSSSFKDFEKLNVHVLMITYRFHQKWKRGKAKYQISLKYLFSLSSAERNLMALQVLIDHQNERSWFPPYVYRF